MGLRFLPLFLGAYQVFPWLTIILYFTCLWAVRALSLTLSHNGILILPVVLGISKKLTLLLRQVAFGGSFLVFCALGRSIFEELPYTQQHNWWSSPAIWAMVEVRNEPFLGFSSLVCLNNRKKANWKGV